MQPDGFTLSVAPNVVSGDYPIIIKDVLIVEDNETRHPCDNYEYTLSVNNATGIRSMATDGSGVQPVYRLDGIQYRHAGKDFNLVRQSDGPVKKVVVR